MAFLCFLIFYLTIIGHNLADETDYNLINSDGSYSFGLSNNDIGSHYHSASASANNVVRGRYGSINPSNNRVEETVYSAGPRGFRARGPNIHRKMDLSQIPRGPIGTPDDPLADPYDEPTYGFGFRTSEYQRREDSDRNGRVTGLYSYLDDVGERHNVRYGAGANTGYQVSNAVPDAPAIVRYSSPLYKTNRKTRGRIAYERGPGAQYKFIASGPDQRRSESTDADGITRGSYSYLDDKGIQRTVQYIAGAGIGYRIVQSTTGPGSHLVPRPAIPEFGLTAQSNDITDDDGTGFTAAESGSILPARDPSEDRLDTDKDISFLGRFDSTGSSDSNKNRERDRDRLYSSGRDRPLNRGSGFGSGSDQSNRKSPSSSSAGNDSQFDISDSHNVNRFNKLNSEEDQSSSISSNRRGSNRFGSSSKNSHVSRDRDNSPPFVSSNRYDLEQDRTTDWRDRSRDSTIVKNVGDWYVGLPPGSAVRAHVQNIDLLPLGGRQPSPSEALRRDEKRSRRF